MDVSLRLVSVRKWEQGWVCPAPLHVCLLLFWLSCLAQLLPEIWRHDLPHHLQYLELQLSKMLSRIPLKGGRGSEGLYRSFSDVSANGQVHMGTKNSRGGKIETKHLRFLQ